MNPMKLVLVTAMLAVAAVAATPTASAHTLKMATCHGEYNTGSNETNPADDYCTGVWSDAGFECVGIYFPNSEPPMCIGVDPKFVAYLLDATTTASPGLPTEAVGA